MPNPSLILALKVVVLATWFVSAAGFFFADTTLFGRLGRLLFALLAVVHTLECALFYKTLKRTGRPLGAELAQTFLFGVIHYSEARALVSSAEVSPGTAPEG